MATSTITPTPDKSLDLRFPKANAASLQSLVTAIIASAGTQNMGLGIFSCQAAVGSALTGHSGTGIVIAKYTPSSNRIDYIAETSGSYLAIGRIDVTDPSNPDVTITWVSS